MSIWQDLVDRHGYNGGYQTIKRFFRKLCGSHSLTTSSRNILTAPGEEAQVDYGTGPHGALRQKRQVPAPRKGLELIRYTSRESNPALIFDVAHIKIAHAAAKKPPSLPPHDFILEVLTDFIKSNAVAAGAATPELNFQWLTGSSESDPPQPILIFH